jgi:hypothetical protein
LNILQVLYIIFLLGSLAFGLQALLLGLGGKLSVLYRRDWKRVLALASLVGLTVVGLSIVTSTVLSLGAIYFCASVLVYTLLAGGALNLYKMKRIKPSPLPPPSPTADVDIKQMLQKRGFKELVEEED